MCYCVVFIGDGVTFTLDALLLMIIVSYVLVLDIAVMFISSLIVTR